MRAKVDRHYQAERCLSRGGGKWLSHCESEAILLKTLVTKFRKDLLILSCWIEALNGKGAPVFELFWLLFGNTRILSYPQSAVCYIFEPQSVTWKALT